MTEQAFKIAMLLSIIIGFFFNIVGVTSKNRGDKAIIFLNLFVLFFTLNNVQIILADYGYISLNFYQRKLLIPWYSLIIPCFYSFITHYLQVIPNTFIL